MWSWGLEGDSVSATWTTDSGFCLFYVALFFANVKEGLPESSLHGSEHKVDMEMLFRGECSHQPCFN